MSIEDYYQEIIKGCDKITPDNESLIKIVIELTLKLHRDKLREDARQQASETPLFKY